MDSEAQDDYNVAFDDDLIFGGNVDSVAPLYDLWALPVSHGFWSVPVDYAAGVGEENADAYEGEMSQNMSNKLESREQDVQTEDWTEEKSINTDEDWNTNVRRMQERNEELELQYENLLKQQSSKQNEHTRKVESLEKKKDEKKKQYQNVMEKIESLRVKLDLNSSKTTRKNFTVKLEELTAEKERMAEGNKKLAQELEEAERKLKTHIEEQNTERLSWKKELADLRAEKENLGGQVEEAKKEAQKDEIAALESLREMVISEVEDWIADAEKYISTLRLDSSHQQHRQRLEWEKNLALTSNSLTDLKNKFNEHLKLLQNGQQMDSLPTIPLPNLPNVPTLPTPRAPPPSSVTPPQFYPAPVSTATRSRSCDSGLHVPTQAGHAPGTRPQLTAPTVFPLTTRVPLAPHTAVSGGNAVGNAVGMATQGPMPVLQRRTLSSQALPANPPPTGKLEQLLDKLGTHYPQCTRTQLMNILQQIKNERGTMAGMSMDDLKHQVAQRLAQSERLAPGPMGPSSRAFSGPLGPVLRPPAQPSMPVRAPGVAVYQRLPVQPLAPLARKLCLMCQNHVEPGTQYNTNCPHTLHKECISVWHQSSKNNTCPFCPSK